MRPPPSSVEPPVTGKCGFLLFSRSVPSPNMCICIYYVIGVFIFVFVLCCAEKEEGETEVIID